MTTHEEAVQVLNLETLRAAARGELDLNRLAREELASRGLDYFTGAWVGFETARRLLATTAVIRDGGEARRVSIVENDAREQCEVCEADLATTTRWGIAVCPACAASHDDLGLDDEQVDDEQALYALIQDGAIVDDTLGPLSTWREANKDGWDRDMAAALVALKVGEETTLGGGAAAEAIVRRVR